MRVIAEAKNGSIDYFYLSTHKERGAKTSSTMVIPLSSLEHDCICCMPLIRLTPYSKRKSDTELEKES